MADILLIDDDENIHEIVSLFLENDGHTVTCVASGQEGLARADASPPELIILDVAMPVMDGIETYNALKANPNIADIPVMILSVHHRNEIGREIREQGRVAYVEKPIQMQDLLARVHELLPHNDRA